LPKKEKWIQKASKTHSKGSLHRQLGIPQNQKIPRKLLRDIKGTDIGKKSHGCTVTSLLKKRVVFALNATQHQQG
jgi:hypothetical protein